MEDNGTKKHSNEKDSLLDCSMIIFEKDHETEDEAFSFQHEDSLASPQGKLTKRANIDTTPGSDQVYMPRSRNFSFSSEVESTYKSKNDDVEQSNFDSLLRAYEQQSIYALHPSKIVDKEQQVKPKNNMNVPKVKRYGISFENCCTEDMAECCDMVGLHEKLNTCFNRRYDWKRRDYKKKIEHERYSEDATLESCDDDKSSWEGRNRCTGSSIIIPISQKLHGNYNAEPSISIQSMYPATNSNPERNLERPLEQLHEVQRSMLVRDSRRLRIARSHKQRMHAKYQQQQLASQQSLIS